MRWCVFAVLIWINLGIAQSFSTYTSRDGLSQSSVQAMFQDRYGFLWVGTHDGLNRYNGDEFVIFRRNFNDSTSISSNEINDIIQSKNGDYWIATAAGVNRLIDPFDTTFDRLSYQPGNESGLIYRHCNALAEDARGAIWIGTTRGLSVYQPKSGTFKNFVATDTGIGLPANHISDILVDSYQNVIINASGTVVVYHYMTDTFDALPDLPEITTLFEDSKRRLWMGTARDGLILYDMKNRQILKRFGRQFNGITGIAERKVDELWIGTRSDGIALFYPERDVTHLLTAGQTDNGLKSNRIRSVQRGIHDIMWVAYEDDGFSKYDPNSVIFKHLNNRTGGRHSILARKVWSIEEGPDQSINVGFQNGLSRLDSRSGRVTHWTTGPSSRPRLPGGHITDMSFDSYGNMWMAVYQSGVARLNPDGTKLTVIDSTHPGLTFFSNRARRGIAMARQVIVDQDGIVWIGGYGLYRYEPVTRSFEFFLPNPDKPKNPKRFDDKVNSLMIDDPYVWIGTEESGLFRFHRHTHTFVNWSRRAGTRMASDYIMGIQKDQYGNIWFGTLLGLHQLNVKTGRVRVFTTADGLPNDCIYGITDDPNHNLWLSTNNGLVKATLTSDSTARFEIFDNENNVQSLEFNQFAYHQGQSGKSYFGGVNGLNIIESDQIHSRDIPPYTYLANIRLANRSIPLFRDQQPELTFHTDEPFIQFDLVTVQYSDPKNVKYEYRLEGFNSDWLPIGRRSSVSFSNLAGGKYTLRIRSYTNPDDKPDHDEHIRFTMVPPFWQTDLFLILSIGFILLATSILIIRRLIRIRTVREALESQIRERTITIAEKVRALEDANRHISEQKMELETTNQQLETALDELHVERKRHQTMIEMIVHDLKNPLNNILAVKEGPLDSLDVNVIQMSGQQILNLSTTLLETARFEQDDLELHFSDQNAYQLVTDAIHSVKLLANQKHIEIQNHVNPVVFVQIDRDIILRVLMNLMINAIKHSNYGSSIDVVCEMHEGFITVGVRDYGKGIPAEYLDRIFEKYTSFDSSHSGIQSSGLGLAFCKLAMRRHHTQIWVESTPGKATTFYIDLKTSIIKNLHPDGVPDETGKPSQTLMLTDIDRAHLRPYTERLAGLRITETSDIIAVLDSIKTNRETIIIWIQQLKYAALNMEADHFRHLLETVETPNA